MINEKAKKIYRTLLFDCAAYFIALAIVHQMGTKLPMLFGIGFIDGEIKPRVQVPIMISGIVAIYGLICARMEIQFLW